MLHDEPAREAWREYRTALDLDHIDHGSQRLLPLLYRNLLALGIDDPLLTRIKGVYRYHWLRNQLQLQFLATLLRALDESGVPVLVLKGAALALLN
ncbi:MAG: nucleotidyltransferase family protein, partial [Chloroflexi bacterium]|nr:nucleotidyltransferase family protein [Chloroflexota bacterium]